MFDFSENDEAKFAIDEVIRSVLKDGCSFEVVKEKVELHFNCKLSEIDCSYIDQKYADILTECWLDEASQLMFKHAQKRNNNQTNICEGLPLDEAAGGNDESFDSENKILSFVEDLNVIDSFEDCVDSDIFAESKFTTLIYKQLKVSATLQSKENNIIFKFKQNSLLDIKNETKIHQAEIKFLNCFLELLKSSKNVLACCKILQVQQFINNEITFQDFLLNLQKCNLPLDNKLKQAGKKLGNQKLFFFKSALNKIVTEYLEPVVISEKSENGRLVLEVKAKHIIISEITPKIEKSLGFEKIEEVRFVSTKGVVHIDDNLNQSLWHGKNIVLFSESVIVSSDRNIVWDISGKNAEEPSYTEKAGTTESGQGITGIDGNVGESGGNFLMLFSHIENSDQLKIVSNGGKGSKGQDGGDGRTGQDGAYLTTIEFGDSGKFPPVSKFFDSEKLKNLQKTISSVYDNIDCIDRLFVGWSDLGPVSKENFWNYCMFVSENDLKNLYFEVKTKDGCKTTFSFYFGGLFTVCQSLLLHEGADGEEGKPGGLGGVGGQGGFAGTIDILDLQKSNICVSASNGSQGTNGNPGSQGAPGKGGLDIAYVDRSSMYLPWKEWHKEYKSPSGEKVKLSIQRGSDEYYDVYCPFKNGYVNVTETKRIERRHHDQKLLILRPTDHRKEVQVVRKKTINVDNIMNQYKEESTILEIGSLQKRLADALEKLEDAIESVVEVEVQTIADVRVVHDAYRYFTYQDSSEVDETDYDFEKSLGDLSSTEIHQEEVNNSLETADILAIELFKSLKHKAKASSLPLADFNMNTHSFKISTRALKEDKKNTNGSDFSTLLCNNTAEYNNMIEECKSLPFDHPAKLCAFKIFLNKLCSNSCCPQPCGKVIDKIQIVFELLEQNKEIENKHLRSFFLPIKKELQNDSRKNILHTLLKSVLEKDDRWKIQFENEIHMDKFLRAMYECFFKQTNCHLVWLLNCPKLKMALGSKLENIIKLICKAFDEHIDSYGPYSEFYREFLALHCSTNIIMYKKNEKNELTLLSNHNPSAKNKKHILMKETEFVSLSIDNDLAKMIESHCVEGSVRKKLLLQLENENKVCVQDCDATNTDLLQDCIGNKNFSAKNKVLCFLNEDSDIESITSTFNNESEKILIESKLKKLKSEVLGNHTILQYMTLQFKSEGMTLKAKELSFVITLILKFALREPQLLDTVTWIIATDDPTCWIAELALLRLETYLKHPLSKDRKTEWKEYLSDQSKNESLMFFVMSLNDESVKVTEEFVSEILCLFKNIANAHSGLSSLHVTEWKYYLKDKYWASKINDIAIWSEDQLKALSFYLTNMENLKGIKLCENLISELQNKAHEFDSGSSREIAVSVIKTLTHSENVIDENFLQKLSEHDLTDWKDLVSEGFLKNDQERPLEDLIRLIKYSGNTSKSLTDNTDEFKKSVETVNMIIPLLGSDIKNFVNITGKVNKVLVESLHNNDYIENEQGNKRNQSGQTIKATFGKKLQNLVKLLTDPNFSTAKINQSTTVESARTPSESGIPGNALPSHTSTDNDMRASVIVELLAQPELSSVTLLPFVTKLIEMKHGKKLKNTQILAITSVLKNSKSTLVQVSTGEGKSLIVVALALIKALHKEKVHVITSSRVLAKRDAEAYKDIFEFCGIEVGHNCSEDIKERKKVYSGCQVVYGELGNFQRDYLLDRFYNENILGDSTFQFVIVDEVDSMLLDRSNNVLYLSHDIPEFDKLVPVFTFVWDSLNRPATTKEELDSIFDIKILKDRVFFEAFGLITKENIQDLDTASTGKQVHLTWEQLVKKCIINRQGRVLKQSFAECCDKLNEVPSDCISKEHLFFLLRKVFDRERTLTIPKHLSSFVEEHLEEWIQSAINALTMEVGRDYVVDVDRSGTSSDRNPNIIILDQGTGNDLFNSEWDGGLHQFLQLKHGCKISLVSLKAVFISNVSFFKLYKNLCGLSGTLGSNRDRDLLLSTYGVDFVTIPTAKPKDFTEEIPMLCLNKEVWSNNIYEEVMSVIKNRSVLIICESVNDVNFLRSKFCGGEHEIHTYTRDYEAFNVAENLEPGKIIIATNLAGRGTDIKLSEDLVANGGLHLCLTYLPSNCRVEEQAYGRVARNGQPGTSKLIFVNSSQREHALNVIDIKKQRDRNEVKRLSEASKFYETQIQSEEMWLKEFKCIYDHLKVKIGQDDKLKEILLKVSLDKWALWLDENSRYISLGSKSTVNVTGSFERLRVDCNSLYSEEFLEWSKHINNPANLINLGLHFTKIDNSKALFLFSRVIEEEELFSEFARYYKVYAKTENEDLKVEDLIDELKVTAGKLKQRIESSLLAANLIDYHKEHIPQSILQVDSFKEQQQNISKIYNVFLQSINNVIGHEISPKTLSKQSTFCKHLTDKVFNDLAATGAIKKQFIESNISEEDLKFVTKFGMTSNTFAEFLKPFKGKEFDEHEFVKEFKKANLMPTKELFWKELLKKQILLNEEKFVFIDLKQLKVLHPSLASELESLPGDEWNNSENSVWLHDQISSTDGDETFIQKVFKQQTLSCIVKKEIFKILKRKEVLFVNKQAIFTKPNPSVAFDYFDSMSKGNIENLNISPEVFQEVIYELKSNSLVKENCERASELDFLVNDDAIRELKLAKHKAYTVEIKCLLSVCFAFKIALNRCMLMLERGETLTIPLPSSPHSNIIDELSAAGIIKDYQLNTGADFKDLEKLRTDEMTKSQYVKVFEKFYDFDQSCQIVNDLITQKWLIPTSNKNRHTKSYSICKKDKKDLSPPLRGETDNIAFVLLNLSQYNEILFKAKEVLVKSLHKFCKKEVVSFHLRPLKVILEENKIHSADDVWFSLNSCDQVFCLKDKSTWKSVWNAFLAMFSGLIELVVGIVVLVKGNKTEGLHIIFSGASDIMNSLCRIFPNSFSRSIASFLYPVLQISSSVKVFSSRFGETVSSWQSLKSFGDKIFESLKHLGEIQAVDGSTTVKTLVKSIISRGIGFEAALESVEHVAELELEKLEENLLKSIFSEFHEFIDSNEFTNQYAKELPKFKEGEISSKILCELNSVIISNKSSIEREFRKITEKLTPTISSIVIEYFNSHNENKSSHSPSTEDEKFSTVLGLVHEKILAEVKPLSTVSDVVEEFKTNLEHFVEKSSKRKSQFQNQNLKTETLQKRLKSFLHHSLKAVTTDPIIFHTAGILFEHSSKAESKKFILKWPHKSSASSKKEQRHYLETLFKITKSKAKDKDLIEIEYDKCLTEMFKVNRNANIFVEMIDRNVEVDAEVIKVSCISSLITLEIRKIVSLEEFDLVVEKNGSVINTRKVSDGFLKVPSYVTTVYLDSNVSHKKEPKFLRMAEVFEAIYSGILHYYPLTSCASELCEMVVDDIKNNKDVYSCFARIDPEHKIELISHINKSVERLHPCQIPGSHWTFNPTSDYDLRETKKVFVSDLEHYTKEGFKHALTKVNYHISKYLSCHFQLNLEDFSATSYEINPQKNKESRNNISCYPSQYVAIVPLPVDEGKLVDFTIKMTLTKADKKKLYAPHCPHIFYEITPLNITYLNHGMRGHVLLNNEVQDPDFSVDKCVSAGELILPSLVSIKCELLILGDLTLSNIYDEVDEVRPNCATLSYQTISKLRTNINSLAKRFQGVQYVVLYIGSELVSSSSSEEMANLIEQVGLEVQEKFCGVKILLCGLLLRTSPAVLKNEKIKAVNVYLQNISREKSWSYSDTNDCFKTLKSTLKGGRYHKGDGVSLNKRGKKQLGEFLSNKVKECLKKSPSKENHDL